MSLAPIPLNLARPAEPRWLSITCLVASAVCLALAVNERDGEYYPKSLAFVGVAIALCTIGTLAPRMAGPGLGRALVRLVALLAVIAQGLTVVRSSPSGWF